MDDLFRDAKIHEVLEGASDAQHIGLVITDGLVNRPGVIALFKNVNASLPS